MTVADGSGLLVFGTGLKDAQPGTIDVNSIPAGNEVKQVLFYWTYKSLNSDDYTAEVNSTEVEGLLIGTSDVLKDDYFRYT